MVTSVFGPGESAAEALAFAGALALQVNYAPPPPKVNTMVSTIYGAACDTHAIAETQAV